MPKRTTRLSELHTAAKEGNLAAVKRCIEQGDSVDAKSYHYYTPLHFAAENGHLKVVEWLIENKADVNATNYYGYTPLYLAAYKGHLDVVTKLIKNKVDVNAKDSQYGYTPLQLAAREGHLDVLEELLKEGASINAKNNWGRYRVGDKDESILKLKKRLNNFFYKILPWNDKEGNTDNNADYSNEFDENFAWVINQFSMHHLPKEIRKDLPLKLEQEDILPKFLSEYGNCIFNKFTSFSNKIESSLQPPFLNKEDYKRLLFSLAEYENNISSSVLATLMYKIKLYYDSYLRYNIRSSLYMPFKLNIFTKLDILKNEILSFKSISPEKAIEVSSLINECRSKILSDFQNFEKQWFQEFKDTWKQKFIPDMEKQMSWTALHKTVLEYLEGAKKRV